MEPGSETGYRVLDARTLEGRRKLVARELGARSIRLNRFDNEPGQAGREHDERETRQEEIYLPVAGGGHIVVDGDEIALEPGVFVLVEPASTRQVVAGPSGLSYLVVGGRVRTPQGTGVDLLWWTGAAAPGLVAVEAVARRR